MDKQAAVGILNRFSQYSLLIFASHARRFVEPYYSLW